MIPPPPPPLSNHSIRPHVWFPLTLRMLLLLEYVSPEEEDALPLDDLFSSSFYEFNDDLLMY